MSHLVPVFESFESHTLTILKKLDTLAAQLHHLSNTSRAMGKVLSGTAAKSSEGFWEQQCREKDATVTEVLRKMQLADEQIAELAKKNGAYVLEILRQREEIAELNYVLEILRQREEIAELNVRLHDAFDTTYMGVRIDCEATRAALDAIIKAFLMRPKVKS